MKKLIKAAFPATIPVLTRYLFLGIAFGILLQSKGYGSIWALFMSVIVYAGSAQFVISDLLAEPFAPISAFLFILMINARHIFYGFSMLGKFCGAGKLKLYLIFATTDETFTLLHSTAVPAEISPNIFYFCISLLNHLYWIAGSVFGAFLGAALPMNPKGIEFVMTALFSAILVEQCRNKRNIIPAMVGIIGSVLCLMIFGESSFMPPAMLLLVGALTVARKPIERRMFDE